MSIDKVIAAKFDSITKDLAAIAANIKQTYTKNPKDLLKDLAKSVDDINDKINLLQPSDKQKILDLLELIEDGVYYDPKEPFPTALAKPKRSHLFIPKQHGVLDGIFYDVGDVVFWSAKRKRIYVIAAKNYVTSITLPDGQKLTGDVLITTKNLGIVEKPADPNTAYLRKNGEWVSLPNSIPDATTLNFGYAQQAKANEVDPKSTTILRTDVYVTLAQILDLFKTYLSIDNSKINPNATYLVTSNGLVVAPPQQTITNATYVKDGIVRFATSKEMSIAFDNVAVKPDLALKEINTFKVKQGNSNLPPTTAGYVKADPLPLYARVATATATANKFTYSWYKLPADYNPDTFNLIKATTAKQGAIVLATQKEIEQGAVGLKAISAIDFYNYMQDSPLLKATKLNQQGVYVYTTNGWTQLQFKEATTTKKGTVEYTTVAELEKGIYPKPKALTPKVLADYMATFVDTSGTTPTATPNTIFGYKNGNFVPLSITKDFDAHATFADLGTVKRADYSKTKDLIEKVLLGRGLSSTEQSDLAAMSDDVIDADFMNQFLADFKIPDATFIPPNSSAKYGIYNGKWVKVTGSSNITELERPDGTKLNNIRDTTIFFKKDLVAPDYIGKEGDICHVLSTHFKPIPATKNPPTQLQTLTATGKWTYVKDSYYLDKLNNQWLHIKDSFVKVKGSWERVTRTKYKTK